MNQKESKYLNEKKYQHYDTDSIIFIKKIEKIRDDVLFKQSVRQTDFLTVYEQSIVSKIIGNTCVNLSFFGGNIPTERKIAILSSDLYEITPEVIYLQINYREFEKNLTHRDILGAILTLGIERRLIGDIFVHQGYAQVAVKKNIVSYLLEHLLKVGNYPVTVKQIIALEEKEQNFLEKIIFVHSLRVDGILSHAFGISREEVKKHLLNGHVQKNACPIQRMNLVCEVNDIISFRKHGRIYLHEIVQTKKDKYKIVIHIPLD